MEEQCDIMVIAAHPDDAEFGAAGSVAKWVAEGKKIIYVVCTSGDKGTSDTSIRPEQLALTREAEQTAAAETLGVRKVIFLRHSDQTLEDTPEFRKELVRQIRLYRPHTVISADPYRRYIWHRDHRITGRVVLDAVYPYARDFLAYPDLWAEGVKPHNVAEVLLWATPEPNYYVDITAYFETKMAALRCHKSQVSADAEEWVRGWARETAQGQGFELAEAFHREEIE